MSFVQFTPTLEDDDLEMLSDTPPFTTPSTVSRSASQKCKQPSKKEGGNGPGVSQRGRNWNERDSILLVQAYQCSEEKKSRMNLLYNII